MRINTVKFFNLSFLGFGLLFIIIGAGSTFFQLSEYYGSEAARTGSFFSRYGFLLVFSGTGLVFFLTGLFFTLNSYILRKRKTMLILGGHWVMAEICEVKTNFNVSVNDRHPCNIHCKYTEGGRDYFFKSHDIWFDVSFDPGAKIRVWLDRDDYDLYYVDTDDLERNHSGPSGTGPAD